MIYQRGHLARPLDAVLGNSSRLACLRALARAKGPLSGRQVARLGGINHQAAALALKDLESVGVIARRPAARSIQWSLDRGNFLVDETLRELFEAEVRHADEIVAAINDALRAVAADLQARFAIELRAATLSRAQAPSRPDLADGWQLLPTEGPPRVFSAGF